MVSGAVLSPLGVLLLIVSENSTQILLYSGLMAIGTAAFTGANWALTADLAPPAEGARFLGLANIGTAGAAAVARLFGPVVDWVNGMAKGAGYSVVFAISALAFVVSLLFLRKVVVLPEPLASSQLVVNIAKACFPRTLRTGHCLVGNQILIAPNPGGTPGV